ncbi:uncharacterized protein LOC105219149 isoform X3 [Zeugodacus cucurbitae]|uniref:uncharacterized protein LOC105219149 isoform X3 n=1 Tax=Zeugodacus cucurbitae TaxID=28588 RepID=UPI0023D9393E|nr:uncharacterized protein LOC105219149 isoform X3 [Zeugodacus cucurbitae]
MMMDNFKDTNITYTYLVSLDTEFISNNISKEYAFGIFAKAIEQSEITAGDALNLWVKKLKTVYRYEDFCRSDWGFLTICCQNYFEKMTLDDTSAADNKTYKQLSCWLKESAEFLKSIHICDGKFNLTGICLFLDYILESVEKSCRFLAVNENKSDLISQTGWINSLHNLSHKLIWDCLENHGHIYLSDTEYRALSHYINGLCSSIAIDTFIEIKTKIEAWKFVAKFILKNGTHLRMYNKHLEENFSWPKLPIRILLREVETSLVMIYKKLISNHIGGRDYCYELILVYLRCCITNYDDEFFECGVELLIEIFKRCVQRLDVFTDAERFDEIIDVYASLTLLDSSGAMLRNIQQYIIKGDLALSFACTELLILVSSCKNSRVDELNDGLQFWMETNNRSAQFSSNYSRLNVERLIGNYISLCSGARLEQNTDLQLHQAINSQNNYNGGNSISEATMAIGKLSRLIEIFERTEMSLKDYYNFVITLLLISLYYHSHPHIVLGECSGIVVAQMYELVKYKAEVSDCLQQKIAELLTKVCKPCLINTKPQFKRFMSAGLLLMANNNINAEAQLKILTCIKDYIHSGTYFPMLSFWLIIHSCRKQNANLLVRKIAEAIYTQLEIPDIIQVITFETASEASHNPAADFIRIANRDNNGKSALSIRPCFVHRKRSRKDIEHDGKEIEDTIQNINLLLRKIKIFSKQLKWIDFVKLNKIYNDIKEITDHHNSVE